jgi:hypothetical protein
MVLYPPLCNALGFDTPWTGVMLGDLMVSADSESFEAIARAMLAADSTRRMKRLSAPWMSKSPGRSDALTASAPGRRQ